MKKKARKSKISREMVIEPVLLQKLLRMDAELKNAVLTLEVERLKDKVRTLEMKDICRQLSNIVLEAKNNFQQVTEEVESQYDISMRDYSYDTETGKLISTDQ